MTEAHDLWGALVVSGRVLLGMAAGVVVLLLLAGSPAPFALTAAIVVSFFASLIAGREVGVAAALAVSFLYSLQHLVDANGVFATDTTWRSFVALTGSCVGLALTADRLRMTGHVDRVRGRPAALPDDAVDRGWWER